MTFFLKYLDVVRKPNPMSTINPLKNPKGKIIDLQDRINTLEKSFAWSKTVNDWQKKNKFIDIDRLPKVSMEKLGLLWINEDIQRHLDDKHCANIANVNGFDPALLQCVQCIKTSDNKFISIDSQHTAATIAALIYFGFLKNCSNWKEFKFPFQYIETDNLAYARRAFSILNGKGKKKQSAYQQLRNSVYIVRLDDDRTDQDDVDIEKKVSIAESFDCFPIETASIYEKYPGTFTNIATFKTLTENELKLAFSWHNKYFHYEPIHVSLFFIFRDISRAFESAKITVTEKLQEEVAALIQNLFVNLSQFQTNVSTAHTEWTKKRYGYQANWDDDAYACSLMQLYKKFGGEETVPLTLLDRFDGLIDFFDQDLLNLTE